MLKDNANDLAFMKSVVAKLKGGDVKEIVAAVIKKLPEQKDILSDTPEDLRDKMETLLEDERLSIKSIGGVNKFLELFLEEFLKKHIHRFVPTSGSGAQGGSIVRFHDLSASLDGSTKTFTLPAFFRIISITISSTPGPLRPTTDFTEDPANFQITFTSEIDAATQLASGQTCIILYSELI